jgi:hypothetical protein
MLILWCLRRSVFPLLWLGLSVAFVVFAVVLHETESFNEELGRLAEENGWASTMLSPFAGVFIAFALRVSVTVLSFVAAYPLSRWNEASDFAHGRRSGSRWRLWSDRLHLTRAYRSLRWTWAVRQAAIERLGHLGRFFDACQVTLRWVGVASFVAFIVIVTFVSASAAS